LGVFGMHDVLREIVRYKLDGWVGLMLNAGWNPSIIESSGQTALHFALDLEFPPLSPRIIRVLVQAASDLAIQDNSGCTPLHLAVQKADHHTTKLLLDAGLDPWIENKQGFTAIDIAVGVGNPEVLEEILQKATVKTVAKLPL
jgi:ankyrin repeat protein